MSAYAESLSCSPHVLAAVPSKCYTRDQIGSVLCNALQRMGVRRKVGSAMDMDGHRVELVDALGGGELSVVAGDGRGWSGSIPSQGMRDRAVRRWVGVGQ